MKLTVCMSFRYGVPVRLGFLPYLISLALTLISIDLACHTLIVP